MASVIGVLVLFLATLTLGGCAGLPYGALGALGALGNGGAYGGGYGGAAYPQGYPSAAAIPVPVPVPVDPGYAGGYGPQVQQPYYAPQPYANNYNGTAVYAPGPNVVGAPLGPQGDPRIHRREWDQAARIRQGRRDGSLTPHEAQRLWGEQRRIRGAEGRMGANGNLSPRERGRLNTMQNRASQDIYRGRHNGVVQPGAPGPQSGNGPVGLVGQHQINGTRMQGPTQTQARPTQPGVAPRGSIIPIPGQ
jgi:hypothetical protein